MSVAITETGRLDLDTPFPLPAGSIDAFERDGFVKLDGVLGPAVLEYYGREISGQVLALNTLDLPMEQRDTYQKAFLQVTNLWRKSEAVRTFVMGRRLGRIAAELMGVDGVRIYHDQALYKEPGGGFTPWHADQYYWPLASERCVTAWIPLQATPVEMGALAFAVGSHHHEIGRDVPISDASEARLQQIVEAAGFTYACAPYAAGDVSFHAGWTLHRAGGNGTPHPRRVMTIIYMDRDMRLARPKNDNQQLDREAFCPGIADGGIIDSELNPIVWERAA
jgi:hypothetical protein